MRSADAHLTPQEFEDLLFAAADSNVTTADRAAAHEAQQHLDGCDVCKGMAKKYANADAMLQALRQRARTRTGTPNRPPRGTDASSSNCPSEETWLRLAAGLIDDAAATQYVSHAAQCDYCGPLLREAMEDLTQDATAEEEADFNSLPSASAAWQRELAQKLAATPHGATSANESNSPDPASARKKPFDTKPRGRSWWPRVAFATAGLATVIVAGRFGWERMNPDPNELLGEAYSKHRTIELRMTGAPYGPLQVERGAEQGDLPDTFYTAKAIILNKASRYPDQPRWLQALARVYLLEWDYGRALDKLDDALATSPDDASLHLDKAIALYERAQKGTQPALDYGAAADELGKVLKGNPDNPVALFNRCAIYEEIPLPSEGVADCEHYLQVDPSGRWAEEVRVRLDRLRKLLKDHADAAAQPLLGPEMFVRVAGDPVRVAQVESRIEDYQDLAITTWLPGAFTPNVEPAQQALAQNALNSLGKLLQVYHGDRWLSDFLAHATRSTQSANATIALRDCLRRSMMGDAVGAYEDSSTAASMFRAAGNEAGALRASGERIHALRNSQQGSRCVSEGGAVANRLKSHKYLWIQEQLDIDMASCLLMVGEFERARRYASNAKRDSRKHDYPVLELRSVGLIASVETDEGNLGEAWAQDLHGLSEYWRSPFSPARRAQQFYDDLTYSAENSNQLSLASDLARESVRMVSRAGDRKLEALSRQHLAKIALRDGNLVLAAAELSLSSHLLDSLPNAESLKADRFYAQVGLAEVALRQGHLLEADVRLTALEHDVGWIASFTVARAFYRTFGDLRQRQGRVREAENAYLQAVRFADASLTKLDTSTARYNWTQENSGLYRSLVELELQLGDSEAALAVWEWYRAALSGATSLPSNSLQSFLADHRLLSLMESMGNRTIVAYSVRPTGLEIWTFNGSSPQSKFVAVDPSYLSMLASNFSTMCADRNSNLSALRTKGRKLYDLLLGPVEKQLSTERVVVIEPDEIISDLPFDALVTSDGRYLGQAYRTVQSPGVAYEHYLRPAGSLQRDARVLVIASKASFVGLDPGPDISQEAESIAASFPEARLLADPNATVQEMQAQLPNVESLHFIGHAISTPDREGLVMFERSGDSEATLWGADDVRERFFRRTQLVVLSACSTGKSYRGRRGVQGALMRSLLLAGVPNVVASRWNVDSRLTARFMDVFYRTLASGESVSSSIHAAETAMSNQGETQHPYYWAAFAVFGRA